MILKFFFCPQQMRSLWKLSAKEMFWKCREKIKVGITIRRLIYNSPLMRFLNVSRTGKQSKEMLKLLAMKTETE